MEKLIEACMGMASGLLCQYGEFYPFAFGLTFNEEAINIATVTDSDTPEPEHLVRELSKALRVSNEETKFKAVCICVDIFYSPPGANGKTDALQLRLNFRENEPIDLIIPYHISNGKIFLKESIEQIGENYMDFRD